MKISYIASWNKNVMLGSFIADSYSASFSGNKASFTSCLPSNSLSTYPKHIYSQISGLRLASANSFSVAIVSTSILSGYITVNITSETLFEEIEFSYLLIYQTPITGKIISLSSVI